MRQLGSGLIVAAVWILAAGCASAPPRSPTLAPGPAATRPAPTLDSRVTTTPPGELAQTPAGPQTTVLTVWMPEGFEPVGASAGGQALAEQVIAFDQARPDIRVEFVPKRLRGVGGITGYLRSAPAVAPGTLPDLTLLDRDSLAEMARDGLIVAIGGLVDPAVVEGLYPVARGVGTVDEQLVGLPYLLEIDHAVYRVADFRTPPVTFQMALDSRKPLAMSAGAMGDVNSTTLLQYLAAGGTLDDGAGHAALDGAALTAVLTYYDQAHKQGVFDTAYFQNSDPAASWAAYRSGQAALAGVTSTLYLSSGSAAADSGLMPIPTASGQPFTLVRGWSWVVVTGDPQRQAAAMALLNFLVNPVNQGRYSEAAGWLPSQPGALAVWGSDHDGYAAFVGQLLDRGVPMPDARLRAVSGAAIQTALEAVLLKNVSPAQAAAQAVEAVKGK